MKVEEDGMFIISNETGCLDWVLPTSLIETEEARISYERQMAPHMEWFTTRLIAACKSGNRNRLFDLLGKLEKNYDAEAAGVITDIVA